MREGSHLGVAVSGTSASLLSPSFPPSLSLTLSILSPYLPPSLSLSFFSTVVPHYKTFLKSLKIIRAGSYKGGLSRECASTFYRQTQVLTRAE